MHLSWRRVVWRVGMIALASGSLALGLRALANASTFQLFGQYVARVETDVPVVALTFDDGPHPDHTRTVLEVLGRHRARATFFMMGSNVERYPAIVRDVHKAGHEIGNHSYSHPRMVLRRPERVRAEIVRTDELLRGAGVTGPIHFRAPHSSKLVVLPYVLGQLGKLSVLADVDPEEWRRRPAAVMTREILDRVRPGSIVMLHDTAGAETIRTLEDVLAALGARGYQFATVSELLALGSV